MNEFALVALLAAGAFAIRMLWRSDARAETAMWERAGRILGGTVERTTDGDLLLRLEVDGVPLVVRTRSERVGNTSSRVTVAQASPLPGARGVRLAVTPRGVAGRLARPLVDAALPGTPIATGDDRFDAAFRVRSEPHALAVELLGASLRLALIGAEQGFAIEDDELLLERDGAPTTLEPILAFARFAERLVRAWVETTRGPERVARALGWADEPDAARAFDPSHDAVVARGARRGTSGELVVRFRDAWALTVVRLLVPSSSAAWSLVRDAEAAGGWAATGDVPEPVLRVATNAWRTLVGVQRTEAALELAFDGLAIEPAPVAATLDAVLDTAALPSPYR